MGDGTTEIRAVFFDFAGVLVGWRVSQETRWRYVAQQAGMDLPALTDFLQQGDLYRAVQQGRTSREAWWQERMDALGATDEQRVLWQTLLYSSWPPDPGCLALIDELQARDVRLGLLTNSGYSSARLVERYPFLKGFDAVLLAAETGAPKPTPAAFKRAAQAVGVPPATILLVDDTSSNVAGARRAGWQAHHFEDAATLRTELAAWGLVEP